MYLIKRKSVYYIRYIDEAENRLRQLSTKCRNKKDALQFLSSFQSEVKKRKKLQFITVNKFENEYLEYVNKIHSQNYYVAIERTFNRLIKEIGDIPLVKLDRITIEKFLFDVFSKAMWNARLYHTNLRAAFNYAVSRNYIESNPIQKIKLPKLPEKINLYISETEFNSILSKTKNQILRDVFLFAYNTGMRLSELTNLKWRSVSPKEGIIKVENTETCTTRSKKSEILKRRLPNVMDITKDVYVFSRDGFKLNNDFVSRQFKKSLRGASLNEGFHFHLLRASYISNLAKRNVPLAAIQKLVGHENIRITEKHYLSVQNDSLIKAMRILDAEGLNKSLLNG